MNEEEKIYIFNEYVLSYDKGQNDRSCLIISKTQNGKMYVMSSLYDESAELISKILDNFQQEINKYKNIIKLLKHFGESSLDIIYALKDNIEPTENEWLNLLEYEKYLKELKGSDS